MEQSYRSLASANAGERLAIRRIMSSQAKHLCAQVGVREGDEVLCRANTHSCLILKTPNGRVVSLDQDWARFIQIEVPSSRPLAG